MKNTKKNTITVKDAAKFFWGKKEFETALKTEHENTQSEICMLSDSFATNGSFMIYSAGALEFEPVKNSRYCDLPREKINPVIMPYIDASACAKIPAALFGHLAAEHGKKIHLAAAGRWCSFVANDPDHGMHVEDGADMGEFFNLGGIKATFDGVEIAKIFKKFKVDGVEICHPSKGSDFMRFYVTFKGAKFTAVLLKCYRDEYAADFEDEAAALVESWAAEDESSAPAPVEAIAKAPAKKIAAMSAPKCENSDENSENTEESAENCKNSTKNGVKIEKNADFGTVEIYFNSKPSQVVREALKTARFRWHAVKKCWYGKPENAKNVMTTSSEARAVLHAILGTFEAENVEGGAEVLPNGKTAPKRTESAENVKAPEPVEGARDFVRDIKRGDVVRITGVTGATGKAINGFYYVETVHGAGDYWLNSLKRDRGSDFEGIGKKSHSWPLRCYANNHKVREEFRENIKDAKIEGMGPRSAAVYSLMLRNLDELRNSLKNYRDWPEQQKRADDLAADLRRMREENPGLEQFAAKLDEKFKPTGPGLAIRADGLEVRDNNGTWNKYALSMRHKDDSVIIWGSYYGRSRSATIPAGFGFDVTNNSDSMTDYFEPDGATVKQDHPLFDILVRIIDAGRGRYELTDADAEAIAAHLKAKEAAAEAARESERAEYVEKCKKQEQHAREVIAAYVEAMPADPFGPRVLVLWSELGALHEGSVEAAGDAGEAGAVIYSPAAFDAISADLGDYFRDECGYYKTKFEFIDGEFHFTDRADIGDGCRSVSEMLRGHVEYIDAHPGEGYMLNGGATPGEEETREAWRRWKAATTCDAGAIIEALGGLEA